MKKIFLGLIIFTITISIFGCAKKEETVIGDEPYFGESVRVIDETDIEETKMNDEKEFILTKDAFIKKSEKEEVKSDDGNITYMTLNYEQISPMDGINVTSGIKDVLDTLNNTIIENVDNFKGQLDEVKECFEEREDCPPYEYQSIIKVLSAKTLDDATILTLENEEYYYLAGAHGSTILSFINYDDKEGKNITLDDILCNKSENKDILKEKILEKLKTMEDDLFPEYKDSVNEYFTNPEYKLDFSIDNPGENNASLVVYFQQYAIAPYSSGIIEVELTPDESYMDLKYFK